MYELIEDVPITDVLPVEYAEAGGLIGVRIDKRTAQIVERCMMAFSSVEESLKAQLLSISELSDRAQAHSEKPKDHYGWIGVDFDGTLAEENSAGWPTPGPPIEAVVTLVRKWLESGYDVRILTARAVHPDYYGPVYLFCREHFGTPLPVTDRKDFRMHFAVDDRAMQVIRNTGCFVQDMVPGRIERVGF